MRRLGSINVSVRSLHFPLHYFLALAASCVLYNRKEHSKGFSIFKQDM